MERSCKPRSSAASFVISYGVFDAQGKRVADGDVNGERLMLPIGTYQVRLDLSTSKVVQEVTIGSLNEVTVRMRQTGKGVTTELISGAKP